LEVQITVHLHSKLIVETPEGKKRRLEIEIAENSRVKDLVSLLELTIEPRLLLVGINDQPAGIESRLEDGDRVHLILPVSGG